MHHDPPEVAWLPPELEDGAEPVLKPADELELLVLLVLLELLEDDGELVLLDDEFELLEDELVLLDAPEWFAEVEPVDAELAVCVDPGSTRATTPAVAALATPTAAVAERTLARPRFLAAIALMILSRFMVPSSAPVLGVLCGVILKQL